MKKSIEADRIGMDNHQETAQSNTLLRGAQFPAAPRYATDRASLERESDITYFVASGPGGQHRNKVETGVRLVHRPSGITVTATERRSQYANREAAYARLAERIEQAQRPVTPRKPTRPSAATRERRLEAKRRVGAIKRQRATPSE